MDEIKISGKKDDTYYVTTDIEPSQLYLREAPPLSNPQIYTLYSNI